MKFISMSVADIRVKPDFHSERDSQLIYGEEVKVLGEDGGYLLVEGVDMLRGYVLSTLVSDGPGRKYKIRRNFRSRAMIFPFGSYVSDDDVARYNIPDDILVPLSSSFNPADLSQEFLAVPYLWGGTSDLGYDCSGYVQRIFRFSNIEVPRNADWQRDNSMTVESFDDAQSGDLVFFEGHVGMYLGDGVMIHSNLHNGGVSYTNLFDQSPYSNSLMKSFEKIGRIRKESAIKLPY